MTSAPAPQAARAHRPPPAEPVEYQGLVRFFVVPAAVIASNAAALLGVVSVLGIVPGLAGAARMLLGTSRHHDSAFRDALGHLRRTLWRDLPVSAGLWVFLVALVLNAGLVTAVEPGQRVFLLGALLPVAWVLVAWISAYVSVAVDPDLERSEVLLEATRRCIARPSRVLLAPAVVIALSPLWLLAPLTIACGLSAAAFLTSTFWGARRD